jgi:hypothetical protein
MTSSAKLAIPRSGVQQLNLINGAPDTRQEITFAAWQSPEKGVPKRVVIRCDGHIVDEQCEQGLGVHNGGLPCGMVNVRYTIGGYVREVLIDATNQSSLTVWAETVDVTAIWDRRRIVRTGNPCKKQIVAASCSVCECGDTGPADARWLDALALDATTGSPEDPDTFVQWSIHPIPPGARGLRFLDALVSGVMFSVPGATSIIAWSADTFARYPDGIIQLNTNGATDTSILIAPPCARFLFLGFPGASTFFEIIDEPTFIEWIIAPNTLPGF